VKMWTILAARSNVSVSRLRNCPFPQGSSDLHFVRTSLLSLHVICSAHATILDLITVIFGGV
jgi:hypothetical protein